MTKLLYECVDDLPGEFWRDVVSFEGLYKVSNLGRVKRVSWSLRAKPGYILKHSIDRAGYPIVRLRKPREGRFGRSVHRLVAQAFIANPAHLPEVNHKDGNKRNFSLDNLEWVTISENKIHSWNVLGCVRKRTYILTSPRGEVFKTTNLSRTLRDRGLTRSTGFSTAGFYRVLSGRYPDYKGWTCSYSDNQQVVL